MEIRDMDKWGSKEEAKKDDNIRTKGKNQQSNTLKRRFEHIHKKKEMSMREDKDIKVAEEELKFLEDEIEILGDTKDTDSKDEGYVELEDEIYAGKNEET